MTNLIVELAAEETSNANRNLLYEFERDPEQVHSLTYTLAYTFKQPFFIADLNMRIITSSDVFFGFVNDDSIQIEKGYLGESLQDFWKKFTRVRTYGRIQLQDVCFNIWIDNGPHEVSKITRFDELPEWWVEFCKKHGRP
jgi:hypothetical protein